MAVAVLSLKLPVLLRKSQCEEPIPCCAYVSNLIPWFVCCCCGGGIAIAKMIPVKLCFGLWILVLAGSSSGVTHFPCVWHVG